MIKTKILSSLDTIFPLDLLEEYPKENCDSVLSNEIYSFQVAYLSESKKNQTFHIKSKCQGCNIRLYSIGLVPSELPAYPIHDDGYIKTEPGLFPDVMNPIKEGDSLFAQPEFCRSIWVECTPLQSGMCSVSLTFTSDDDSKLSECKAEFEVIGCELPEQKLIHTQWFHCDCISNYYRVDIMSQSHWVLMEEYIKYAAQNGINMILTPLFTPPLDTKVAGERPTMQLIDVTIDDGKYLFGFEKLKRWMDMCTACGMKYFEMSHLFTQWGARHAPKIVADKDGEEKTIFGWDTDASGAEYKRFLGEFLPKLTKKLEEWNISKKCFFHISDEPKVEDIKSYNSAKQIVSKYLKNYKIIDALSDIEFYEKGLVENPICANDHIEPFLKADVKGLWTYYCCAQHIKVSNRFIAMPSSRNRIIGLQLYKYDIVGFLHWGYNFWNTQYSLKNINPYQVTDAGCAFPSGDPFIVYPGEEGPIPSIRLKVLQQALFDLRALKLLESMTSKKYVLKILEGELDKPLTFDEYPIDKGYLISVRRKINEEIEKNIQQ